MDYFPWINDDNDEDLAWVMSMPPEIDKKSYLILEDKEIGEWLPPEIVVNISADKGIFIADFLPTVIGLHILSKKLRDILTEEAGSDFNFYPVVLKNAKGRVEKKEYFLAHLKRTLDCVDKTKSDIAYSPINPERAHRIRKLYLDEERIPDDVKIFKLKEKPRLWLTRKDLALKIYRENNNCRGMLFIKLEDYGKMWRKKD